jgi:hypothetical protein
MRTRKRVMHMTFAVSTPEAPTFRVHADVVLAHNPPVNFTVQGEEAVESRMHAPQALTVRGPGG